MFGSLHSLYPLYPLIFNTSGYNGYNKKSLRRDSSLMVAILATISTQMKRECFFPYLLSSDLARVDKSAAISGLERTFARSSASTFVGSPTVFPATLACILDPDSSSHKRPARRVPHFFYNHHQWHILRSSASNLQ